GSDQDPPPLLPPTDPLAGQNKEDIRTNIYPPIITIDGRVDTDLDHLIEDDDNEEDPNYNGPVEDIPNHYPRPHVFSVIHGSLDDDVDSYANDDGTLEHTLVDAPKNFNPGDLQDVASTEAQGARIRPEQAQSGRGGVHAGGGASHLLSLTDRSHNKMHTDGADGDRSHICKSEKHHYDRHLRKPREQLQEAKHEDQKQAKAPRPPPRTSCRNSSDSRRQVYSDESIRPRHLEQVSPAIVLSDSFTATQHRALPSEACAVQQLRHSTPCDGGFRGEAQGEEGAALRYQPSAGKSVSEQTHKSEGEKRVLRRPASCTSKSYRHAKRSDKGFPSSPRQSATRSPRQEECQTDSNDEEYTFITCRETVGKSSATLATESGSLCRMNAHSSGLDGMRKQALEQPLVRRRRSKSHRKHRHHEPESELSSVRGFDSIESDSLELYDPNLSQDQCSSEKYCSDPIAASGKFSHSETEMSKSDTRASVDCPTSRRHSRRSRELPLSKHESRRLAVPPEGAATAEMCANATHPLDKRKRGSPNPAHSNNKENCRIYDAKDGDSQLEPKSNCAQNASQCLAQKYFAISKIDSEKGYRSKFLIQEMNSTENKIPRGDQQSLHGRGPQQPVIDIVENHANDDGGRKQISEPHLGNTIWQDVERSRCVKSPEKEVRNRLHKTYLAEDNRGYHNTRQESNSPPRLARKRGPIVDRETRRLEEALRGGLKRNRSPTKLGWQGYLAANDLEREMSALQERARLLGTESASSSPSNKDEYEFSPSPQTWNGIDQTWRRNMAAYPCRESCSPVWRRRHRSVRERDGRVVHRKSPRASWSFESDQSLLSLVSYKAASRAAPRHRRRISSSQFEAIARTVGTSVDGVSPPQGKSERPLLKTPIDDGFIKHMGSSPTDKDLKRSLKQAMAIAQQSLNAAVKVSKALNLVMTSSCLSIDSCSYNSSVTDHLSPRCYSLEVTPPRHLLRWPPYQRSPSVSSWNTELSCLSAQQPLYKKPMPKFNQTAAASEVGASREEPHFIGKSNEVSIHPERQRSRSVVCDSDRVIKIVPNYNLLANRADGSDNTAPLVSIYISSAASHQETHREANIVSSHIQDYSQLTGAQQHSNCFSKSSLQSYKETINNLSPREQPRDSCILEERQRLMEMAGSNKTSYIPARTQTVCVNMVTAQSFHKNAATKLSDSSNSDVFQSTHESFAFDIMDRKSNYNTKTKQLAMRTNERSREIPTHEDGSLRHAQSSPPTKLAEKFRTSLDFLGPPETHSPMMAAALDFLSQNPDSFPPPHALFRPLSPAFDPSFSKSDKLSPPSSLYCDAPGEALSVAASPFSQSPGSCVDPATYITDGSAVDPPTKRLVKNSNANKGGPKRRASADSKAFRQNKDSFVAKKRSHQHRGGDQCAVIDSNPAEPKSTEKDHDKSEKDTTYSGNRKQDHVNHKNERTVKKKHKDSSKSHNHRKVNNKQIGSGHDPAFEQKVTGDGNGDLNNNVNNNSSSPERTKDKKVPGTTTDNSKSVDDLSPEVDTNEEDGACAINRNQNQPLHPLLVRSPRGQSISETVSNIAGDSWTQDLVKNELYMLKSKARYNRDQSSYRVRKSLCVAMKLAEESLSAAAKVSQLLSQVVHVYQERHPMDTGDIAQLAVQNHAVIDGILASAGYIKARDISKIEEAKYERDDKTNTERLSQHVDFPETQSPYLNPAGAGADTT
ncbi:hypothetical protein EGW08_010580, partial [Elysia chlorotica]